MIDLESGIPISVLANYPDVVLLADVEGQISLGSGDALLAAEIGGDLVLSYDNGSAGDEWIAQMLSTASSDAIATLIIQPGGDVLLDPQSNDQDGEDIVITGKRFRDTDDDSGTNGGYTGDSGYTGFSSGGDGGGSGGGLASPVAPHTQDCATEDGAAVQVAKHVKGELPAGVAGPPDPMKTPSGNDYKTVEFGAVIVRNADGSYGALNDAIYSNDLSDRVNIGFSVGPVVEGFWHSHPERGSVGQQMIDKYPSSFDWQQLAGMAGKTGVVSDPSVWVMGPDGVTREFKLSERAYFDSLDDAPKAKGEGLAGRERSQSCG